jgi:hypothetical protein
MYALGRKQTLLRVNLMSALPQKRTFHAARVSATSGRSLGRA